MYYPSKSPHHEDQNSVTEVGMPEPHHPGSRPPRAEALVPEPDALYEGLGFGAYFPDVFGDASEQGTAQSTHADARPDGRGCGCGPEPAE